MAGILDYFNDIAKVAYKTTPLGILNTASDIGGQVSEKASDYLGEQTMKKTGSPLAATGAYMLPFLAGMVAPGGKTKLAKTEFEAAQELAQQRAALPISEGGLGLPANNTAMDRAKAMGYTTPAYHGTARLPDEGITQFDFSQGRKASGNRDGLLGTFSTDNPAVASDFADFAGAYQQPHVMPLMLKTGNEWNPANYKEISTLIDDFTDFADARKYPGSRFRMAQDIIDSEGARNHIINELGKDSVVLKNTLMDSPDQVTPINQYVSIRPQDIRSKFAAFDPFRRNEADILAGVAAAPVGLLAVDKEKKKKKNK